MERTTVIILKKSLFREADIMATAVSPDWGKMELVCYGAQSVSGKKFPVLDCFNELENRSKSSRTASSFLFVSLVLLSLVFISSKRIDARRILTLLCLITHL